MSFPSSGMPTGAIAPKSGSDNSYVYKVLLKSGKYKYYYPEDIAKMNQAAKNKAIANVNSNTKVKSNLTKQLSTVYPKKTISTDVKNKSLTTANVTPKSSTKTGGVVPERSLNPGETVNISDAGVGTKDAKEAGERVQAQKEAEKNSFWGRISSAADDVKTFFTGAYNTVKTAVSTALGSVKTFASTFIDEKLKPAWQTVSGVINKGLGGAQSMIQKAGKGIENIWNYLTGNEARAAMRDTINDAVTNGPSKDSLAKYTEAKDRYDNTLPGQIEKLVGDIRSTISGGIKSGLGAADKALGISASRETSAAKRAWDEARKENAEAYKAYLDAGRSGNTDEAAKLFEKANEALEKREKAHNEYLSKLSASENTPIGKVTDAIDTAVTGITSTVGKAMGVVKDAYKVATNFFGNDMPEYLTNAFNTVTGAVSDGWTSALGAITSWFNFASANPNMGGSAEGAGDNTNPQLQHGVSFDSVRYAVQHSTSMPTLNDIDHAFFGGSLGTSWLVGPGVGLNAG